MIGNKVIKIVGASVLVGALLSSSGVNAFARTNFWEPFDPNLRLKHCKESFHLGANFEYGAGHSGRDWSGAKANVLRLHDRAENTIAMLLGFDSAIATSQQNAIISNLSSVLTPAEQTIVPNPTQSDNAIAFDGKFNQLEVMLDGQYTVPRRVFGGHVRIVAVLPVIAAKINDVGFSNINTNNSALNNELTKNRELFQQTINSITPLDFGSWSKTGLGDLLVMLEWDRCFKQDKGGIKSVDLNFNLGATAPTAGHRDINKAFSVAFGHDGAWGLPFGLGLGLNTKYKVTVGGDAQFLALFDYTGNWRLKTQVNQTENILLQTGRATKSYGLTWQFNLYLKMINFYKGLSIKAGYEYTKHDSDSLTSSGNNNFNDSVINTAHSLTEWNNHSIFGMINWDSFLVNKKMPGKPQLSFFCKIPVGGRNVINPYTFGGQIAVNF